MIHDDRPPLVKSEVAKFVSDREPLSYSCVIGIHSDRGVLACSVKHSGNTLLEMVVAEIGIEVTGRQKFDVNGWFIDASVFKCLSS